MLCFQYSHTLNFGDWVEIDTMLVDTSVHLLFLYLFEGKWSSEYMYLLDIVNRPGMNWH